MWLKWLPWRYLVRSVAHRHGFLDPVAVLSRLHRFAQPSEVGEPIELLRAGVVFQARGLMNTRAIQHNLDWVWPFWVERQFDPLDPAFIPRAFSVTHVNLTHRNWTAVGIPDCPALPIVDPRGLVTPHWDGWSLDAWVLADDGRELVPSRETDSRQRLDLGQGIAIETETTAEGMSLRARAFVSSDRDATHAPDVPGAAGAPGARGAHSARDAHSARGAPSLRIRWSARCDTLGWLAVVLRPYNPEGVSFIHDIALSEFASVETQGPAGAGESRSCSAWTVDGRQTIELSEAPDHHRFSDYRRGDVHIRIPDNSPDRAVRCDVGLATAAALYRLVPGREREISIAAPLTERDEREPRAHRPTKREPSSSFPHSSWEDALSGACALRVPDERVQFLFDAAIRTLILHSPGEVYPGPYTYKRFWFRDAAFIIDGLLAAGLVSRAERALDRFPRLQTHDGYFRSQDGEWDSNGEALWILDRFRRLTGRPPKPEWLPAIRRGGEWIRRKRIPPGSRHAGLFPPGFSAEHLGLNDYYYWDDFWGVAGLRAAAALLDAASGGVAASGSAAATSGLPATHGAVATRGAAGALAHDPVLAAEFRREAAEFLEVIDESLALIHEERDRHHAGSFTAATGSVTSTDGAGATQVSAAKGAEAFPRANPAAPDRRMDAGAIGSIAAGYPLRLWPADDARLRDTVEYLMGRCFVSGGFFQDMIHSGINAYLTLHVAQVLLRAGDPRYAELIRNVADLASPTGQWPEAIHPATRGGCMGDGQHAWAAAEWVLMIRNCFLREENDGLILCSGIPDEWLAGEGVSLGPTPTSYGAISVSARRTESGVRVEWTWTSPRKMPARFEIRRGRQSGRPGPDVVVADAGAGKIDLPA
jgi:hypothetical protein